MLHSRVDLAKTPGTDITKEAEDPQNLLLLPKPASPPLSNPDRNLQEM